MTESTKVPLSRLKRQILQREGVVLEKHTRRPVRVEDLPDEYPKTPKMKYFEAKYHCHIEQVVFKYSLSDCASYFNSEVDRSTISRWRAHIRQYLGIVQFHA